jgi:ribosomal protein L31E
VKLTAIVEKKLTPYVIISDQVVPLVWDRRIEAIVGKVSLEVNQDLLIGNIELDENIVDVETIVRADKKLYPSVVLTTSIDDKTAMKLKAISISPTPNKDKTIPPLKLQ